MGIENARKYTDDFKRRAVDLAKEIGNGEAAKKLGISVGNISNWIVKIDKTGRVSITDTRSPMETPEDELKRLRKKLPNWKK